MAGTAPPNFWHRLRHTPLRDLNRFQFTGRLDWPARLSAAGLPSPVAQLITRVTRKTRLWRVEKAEVADELIAHFQDGLAATASADSLIGSFGDEKLAAKLIRRAKIRQRSLAWQAWRWFIRGLGVIAILYGVVAADFFFSHPSPSIDYIAQQNRKTLNSLAADRGWPLYREFLITAQAPMQPTTMPGGSVTVPASGDKELPDWIGDNLEGKRWPEAVTWLRAHQPELELLRKATDKPAYGFVLGPNGSINDEGLWPGMGRRSRDQWGQQPSLCYVPLPFLNSARALALLLQADEKLAQLDHDNNRVERDVAAQLNQARQLQQSDSAIITQLVALGIRDIALQSLQRALTVEPRILKDDQLVRLAHQLSGPRIAADLLDTQGERDMFADTLQRVFTDDGQGGGHLTFQGAQFLRSLRPATQPASDAPILLPNLLAEMAGPAALLLASRKAVNDQYDQILDRVDADLRQPLRQIDARAYEDLVRQANHSLVARLQYDIVGLLVPSFNNMQITAERWLGYRDGVTVGMALEIFSRRNGHYPATLNELVPSLLPSIPEDRITGGPVHYVVRDGQPIVYSVGADRIDNHGVPPYMGTPADNLRAADWSFKPTHDKQHDVLWSGDWILYPQPIAREGDQ